MDGVFVRGGAVALLTIGSALPAAAQSPRAARGDTIVRVIDADRFSVRARLDSIKTLWRRFDDEPVTSELSVRLRQQIEAMATAMRAANGPRAAQIIVRGDDGSPFEMHAKGWIGITTGDVPLQEQMGPGGHLVRYFAHPAIVSVERNSPAQAAGIVAGDSLIAYDGMDVVGRTLNLTQMLIPDRKLGVTVRRGGENREYSVIVAKAPSRLFIRRWSSDDPFPGDPEDRVFRIPRSGGGRPFAMIMGGQWDEAGMPHVFTLSANGVFGASMMTLDPVLAKSLNLQPGVLVKGVSNATAADRAGLRAGDVIIAVGDQSVKTLADLQAATMIRADARTVTFQVMRDKKPRVITVTWSSPASP